MIAPCDPEKLRLRPGDPNLTYLAPRSQGSRSTFATPLTNTKPHYSGSILFRLLIGLLYRSG